MIYTINKSPFTSNNLTSCLRFVNNSTPILLYEDGVYGAVPGSVVEKIVKDALANIKVYALSEDLKARGINEVVPGITVIDYAGFVDLVEENNVCPWL